MDTSISLFNDISKSNHILWNIAALLAFRKKIFKHGGACIKVAVFFSCCIKLYSYELSVGVYSNISSVILDGYVSAGTPFAK